MKAYLYSTLGCHLCDKAKAVLWPMLQRYQFTLTEIDIADDDKLIEQYGIRIPVLGAPNSATELNWPFTVEEVDDFFASMSRQ